MALQRYEFLLKTGQQTGQKKRPSPLSLRAAGGGRAASADAAGHAEGGGDGAQDAEQRLQDEFPGLFLFHGAWGLGVKVLFFLNANYANFLDADDADDAD